MKPRKLILLIIAALLVILTAGGTVYVRDYYHASPEAAALLTAEIPGITVTTGKGQIVFRPDEIKAGLIFYPGGKVEYTAYTPLMEKFAEKGFLCVLLKMPLNLAFLGLNAADRVMADFPEIRSWYLAGHSLGGVAAGSYAGKNSDRLEGLILLAAYTTADLSGSGLRVLSLYGSEDGVLNLANYQKNRANLPSDLTEVIIHGGCHAFFGDYGPQKGDGEPSVSREEQMKITAEEAGKLPAK